MIATSCELADRELVAAVREGDDAAFEELYRRYRARVTGYVRRMVRDDARAEDIAQDAFLSALRRMRETSAEIAFKPWIFEIARNAAIDHHRRTSRAEEVSMDAHEALRPSDQGRLAGGAAPDSALIAKERLDHLCGAFDELSDVHTRVLVLRELEGLSYREIGEELDLTRSSVESALFRARRRLEHEYEELSEGRRCEAIRGAIARIAEGMRGGDDERRLARHARRCHSCRRHARELGVEPLPPFARVRGRAAALLPLPWLLRRRGREASADGTTSGGVSGVSAGGGTSGGLSGLLPAGSHLGGVVAERAAALVAVVALAGAGGAALDGAGVVDSGRDRGAEQPAPQTAAQRTTPAGDAARSAGGSRKARATRDRPATKGPRGGSSGAVGQGAKDTTDPAGPGNAATPTGAVNAADVPRLPDAGRLPQVAEAEVTLPDLPQVTAPRVEPPGPRPQVQAPSAPSVELPSAVELPEVPAPAAPGGELDAVTGAVQDTLP
jgi:RNA polymerase sigma factor (sigma-70 family)